MGARGTFKECTRGLRGVQVNPPSPMSQSFDLNTSYDALDNTVYDIFDVDAYCSSLSPPVSTPESIPNTPTASSCSKRHPRTRGHPVLPQPLYHRPSPSYQPPLSPRRPLSPLPTLLSPIREKVVSAQLLPHPPPVLWTPRPLTPPPPLNLPQNSTSALCGCLSISTSGSHKDGNQGSTNRVYGLWLKSSMPQNP